MLAIGEKLLDGSHTVINKDTIRAALRSLGLQVYIEKWLQIIQRTTGVVPPSPGAVLLQRLDALFLELQRPFDAHKAEKRRNFLNYNYVFCRLFQKMGCDKFCMFFPLIRSKVKLRALDETWQAMVASIGWDCPPLHVPASFSVQLESPETCLAQLRLQVASRDLAAKLTVPRKTENHTWGRRPPCAYRRSTPPRRSVPLEQRPQRLVLRLKRKRPAPGGSAR